MAWIANSVINCLSTANVEEHPYRHWLLRNVFPAELAAALDSLDFSVPAELDFGGRRECNNAKRVFASPENQTAYPPLAAVAASMRSPQTIAAIEQICSIDLEGSFLRVEYCMDTQGFWLEPHTDIGAKRFTMLCYLSVGEGSDPCGTDILDANRNVVHSAPFEHNTGAIFIPADNTWHAFAPRRINGVRKSLMINYVGPEWRARHELAFAEPVK